MNTNQIQEIMNDITSCNTRPPSVVAEDIVRAMLKTHLKDMQPMESKSVCEEGVSLKEVLKVLKKYNSDDKVIITTNKWDFPLEEIWEWEWKVRLCISLDNLQTMESKSVGELREKRENFLKQYSMWDNEMCMDLCKIALVDLSTLETKEVEIEKKQSQSTDVSNEVEEAVFNWMKKFFNTDTKEWLVAKD